MSKKRKRKEKAVVEVMPARVEFTENYCDLDNQIALVVRNLKERMAEASAAELDFRTFVNECSQIGARAVALAREVDHLQETLAILKAGMNLPRQSEFADGHQAQTQVPGSTD